MATIAELFTQAVRLHQGGNLAQAERLYRQVIQAEPSHAEAHHLLGILAHQHGSSEDAIAHLRHALALNPVAAAFHFNLGIVFMSRSGFADAARCFSDTLKLEPQHVDAHINLGNVLMSQGHFADAGSCYREALRVNPLHRFAPYNLGNALMGLGQLDEAIFCYRQALERDPENAKACYNLGNALRTRGNLADAEGCFRQTLRMNPNHLDAHDNLGLTLIAQGRFAEASECFRQVVRLAPNHGEAHNTLGVTLIRQGLLVEAAECFRQALRINPHHKDARSNLGNALVGQKQFGEAAACFGQALAIDSGNALALWNRALLCLLQGDFAGGWPGYEQRWAQPGMMPRTFLEPRWDGTPLLSKTILVYAEQGFGDTIQFLRYLPMVQARGGRVVFECQPELTSLLARYPALDQLVLAHTPLPRFDVHVPLLSLPGLFGTTQETIPAQVPYLSADPKLVEYWRQELHSFNPEPTATRPKYVGIAWQGNPCFPGDKSRSIPLSYFAELSRMEGVRLVSLQKGVGVEQLRSLATPFPILDLSERLKTFSDTAAVMMNLDLVISSCTSVPHLAGALGVPVWTMLQFVPDWRWLLDREDSPWYPTMRLFRQNRPGDWGEVFERIKKCLQSHNTPL